MKNKFIWNQEKNNSILKRRNKRGKIIENKQINKYKIRITKSSINLKTYGF